jgi:hypothetical protein
MNNTSQNPFESGLPKTAANHEAMTPVHFLSIPRQFTRITPLLFMGICDTTTQPSSGAAIS